MKLIGAFEIVDHGVEHSQYFQGCGVSFTRFTDVATGIGDTPGEALEDALETLASEWEGFEAIERSPDGLALKASRIEAHSDCEPDSSCDCDVSEADAHECGWHDECELHYHVSVRVLEAPAKEEQSDKVTCPECKKEVCSWHLLWTTDRYRIPWRKVCGDCFESVQADIRGYVHDESYAGESLEEQD